MIEMKLDISEGPPLSLYVNASLLHVSPCPVGNSLLEEPVYFFIALGWGTNAFNYPFVL